MPGVVPARLAELPLQTLSREPPHLFPPCIIHNQPQMKVGDLTRAAEETGLGRFSSLLMQHSTFQTRVTEATELLASDGCQVASVK